MDPHQEGSLSVRIEAPRVKQLFEILRVLRMTMCNSNFQCRIELAISSASSSLTVRTSSRGCAITTAII